MYDLIIIGGGPAGYNAAERAGHAKLSTCLIEKKSLGGVCLNEGCIPSKALFNSAKILDSAKHGGLYGVSIKEASIDHKFVIERKNKIVKPRPESETLDTPQIRIDIDGKGNIVLETSGTRGQQCDLLAGALEASLGALAERVNKETYHHEQD